MSCIHCGHVGRLHGGPTGTCQSPGCSCGIEEVEEKPKPKQESKPVVVVEEKKSSPDFFKTKTVDLDTQKPKGSKIKSIELDFD